MFCSLKQLCVCDFANLADLAAEPSALKLFFCRRGTHVCLWNKQCHLPQTFLLKYWSLVQRMGKGGSHPAAPRFFFFLSWQIIWFENCHYLATFGRSNGTTTTLVMTPVVSEVLSWPITGFHSHSRALTHVPQEKKKICTFSFAPQHPSPGC